MHQNAFCKEAPIEATAQQLPLVNVTSSSTFAQIPTWATLPGEEHRKQIERQLPSEQPRSRKVSRGLPA